MVYANRYFVSKPLSLFAKYGKQVDFQKALTYHLYPFLLGMTFPDGCKRETLKSKLLEEVIPEIPEKRGDIDIANTECVYVIDMIAQMRMCLSTVPNTFEQLILKFIQALPKGYHRIDIVSDTYRNVSIKTAERKKRDTFSKILIGSLKSKLPREMNKFMLNDDSKNSMIKLVFEYVINEKQIPIPLLKTDVIVISGNNECCTVTSGLVTENYELKTNQEETGTKLSLHAIQIIQCNYSKFIRRYRHNDFGFPFNCRPR